MFDVNQLGDLRQKAEERRRTAIEAAERDYQQSVQAIEKVRQLMLSITPTIHGDDLPPVSAPGPAAAVRMAIPYMTKEFTVRDVLKYLEVAYPTRFKPSAISSALFKLTQQRELACVLPGKGRAAGVYTRIEQQAQASPPPVVTNDTQPQGKEVPESKTD